MKNLLDVCLECRRTLPSHRIRYCSERCSNKSEHKVFYPKKIMLNKKVNKDLLIVQELTRGICRRR